ncbi:bifunctional 4-hydroxy-2-oxoglutarate aldolase/2-dehydro-3-deoxy-phosphogluconate aldolase [Ureibacillus chungkukjangi]|uniref:2-dehydro-3-deoxyphosphogluconate aldolase/(4S)-4-hydroxy-2-oxoglutarate aldolase n=1 Tax=Ureibacillus chungkukjangi TaxID=1202712 RepID=A0A318TP08_9BACL|nr:bifunctional 4-hydroxy-2-oxoglutarate aldolase/2-dehydro-3-deoxy-phosphogluconate aldolase [Ureibacillus chungkukjangi]MCM3390173.1 bifunctional 4-hydroxy-2-oxoglutarate aldolase/2-dehydro-3-deoxy-phosphogluconate aldolase [Ureibacillus chungkukjangi]PYF05600.1 2-dehydro-3-deoxyphosphogluconate aldolase/(4S)-4-hydroxy-2-oxoglutarate aldolase [Ureibacillus chungkukjangi]
MYDKLQGIQLIPVLRKVPYHLCQDLVKALSDGGIKAVEITMDSENAIEMIHEVKTQNENLLVGAGTVLTVQDCEKAIEAGAEFIVSPSLNVDVVNLCVEKGIPVIPGVFTPTEMQTAYSAGAKIIKLFPASSLGTKFIKDVKGPLSHIQIMTTGGINLETASTYLVAGADIVGAGSDLIKKEWLQTGNWEAITNEAIAWIKSLD